MSNDTQICFQAAGLLLSYPDEQLLSTLDLVEDAVAATPSAPLFAPVLAHLRAKPLRELQEFHVQEFDLSRRHALHLTYWTDGDTRRRGEVLAAIKQTYRESGLLVNLDGELPDYLPMVLEFAARGDQERGLGLLNSYRASLELLRLGLRKDKLPHEGVVEAVCRCLPGPMARDRADVQTLYGAMFVDAPPIEQVGLETYQIQTGRPA
ncbi:nitrate reductase molybdenum cofactor assembly chaperone [Tessaracoccus flavus]|uniref:Nitrate reductase molybdenum cofactor assembly chaperone n=1 Tax=Tessaracoccus flavus TaxID=1610493 RepID=A0A1Q2CCB9_9ACTN|nr:nitrate reductase molybdenum cofactor assembly chaperone [Tessaracoccus flavus]AQP43759.1 nitrate reductase molybdenum cofactor assembly chaperone [Tessaracoccus flavus]SDY23077.1 respiratory nitrate reductase chaperone NarJ [Tessaracoccus flavus]